MATFNLLYGTSRRSGLIDEPDLRESARQLNADVLGLQEVDRLQDRSSAVDQTAVVAEELGAPYWRFVPALHGTPRDAAPWSASSDDDGSTSSGPTFGVGLVSRLPVRDWHVLRLPTVPVSVPLLAPAGTGARFVPEQPRLALAALVDGPHRPFTAVTAHLSAVPGWNVAQLRAVLSWAETLPAPRLLFGDLNLPAAVVRLAARGWEQLARVPTYPSHRPRLQPDHVLGNGIGRDAVSEVRALWLPVSDHRALGVTVQL